MTRYFYFPHTDKELPVTKHWSLNTKVWILDTARHTPLQVKFIDTNEEDLLFETSEACINYYH